LQDTIYKEETLVVDKKDEGILKQEENNTSTQNIIADTSYLQKKEVNLDLEETLLSQVLRIAIYDEMQAYETYSSIINNLGELEPFVSVKEAEAVHYSALIALLKKYKIDVPANDCFKHINVPKSYIECCEVGVATEINNIKMYDNLIKYTQEEDVKDVLYRLQAASYNNHLPLFRKCVQDFYNQSKNTSAFNPDEMMNKASEYQELLEDIASGNIDQNKIGELLGKMNLSMISGAALGAASSAFLGSYLNKNKE